MSPVANNSPAWSVRLIGLLDDADTKARELAGGLNTEQINWQPHPGTWSVGQCLEHLCKSGEAYVPAIAGALAARKSGGVEEITLGGFSRWFIRSYIDPSPQTKRARAPKKIVPAERVETLVLDRLLRANQAIRNLIVQARDYDVNHIRFRNPFVPLLRFTVGTGLEIVCRHENRHLLQAERTKHSAGFPG